MKQGEKITNPRLVEAMREMVKHDDERTRGQMAKELMDSTLLSPVNKETVLTEKSGPSTRMRFEDIQNTAGERYYLAFTDLDEYAKWNSEENHNEALSVTMEDLGNILLRNVNDLKGFVINPYGENVSITKTLLLSLLKQREAKERSNRDN